MTEFLSCAINEQTTRKDFNNEFHPQDVDQRGPVHQSLSIIHPVLEPRCELKSLWFRSTDRRDAYLETSVNVLLGQSAQELYKHSI